MTELDDVLGEVLARFRDKWSATAMRALDGGALRFGALRRRMDGVSHRMLTVVLRGLERDGFVSRTASETTVRVDYELTPLGRDLLIELARFDRWAGRHAAEVDAARQAFDRRG